MINHILKNWALDESFLYDRMSFICGPRQIGKTTLVQNHLEQVKQKENYHNWDSLSLRQAFASNPLFFIDYLTVNNNGDYMNEDKIVVFGTKKTAEDINLCLWLMSNTDAFKRPNTINISYDTKTGVNKNARTK